MAKRNGRTRSGLHGTRSGSALGRRHQRRQSRLSLAARNSAGQLSRCSRARLCRSRLQFPHASTVHASPVTPMWPSIAACRRGWHAAFGRARAHEPVRLVHDRAPFFHRLARLHALAKGCTFVKTQQGASPSHHAAWPWPRTSSCSRASRLGARQHAERHCGGRQRRTDGTTSKHRAPPFDYRARAELA